EDPQVLSIAPSLLIRPTGTPCRARPRADDFDGLTADLDASDTDALGYARWDDPDACLGNFFCFDTYGSAEGDGEA
ncbi:hypothetical protein, partial [Microbispora hainanensis]|uniref:hypothetical protein n=1 Tax=Microbispora hainanensis TaxID=568844 RepID=UPI001ABF4843